MWAEITGILGKNALFRRCLTMYKYVPDDLKLRFFKYYTSRCGNIAIRNANEYWLLMFKEQSMQYPKTEFIAATDRFHNDI